MMKGPDYSNWLHGNQNHTIKTGRPKLYTKRQKKNAIKPKKYNKDVR